MPSRLLKVFFSGVFFFAAVHGAIAQGLAAIPPLTERVTDTAGLLQPDQRAALEARLADYERAKGTQIAVLTVSSTAPEVIEQYGIRVADAWKIGRKGTADGVILIVAKDNPRDLRRLRLEVGKGLEGAIPDAVAKRILTEDIAPRFRQNDYYGGLVAGVTRIESVLEGEPLPPPQRQAERDAGQGSWSLPLLLLLFIVGSFLVNALRPRRLSYVAGNRALNRSARGPGSSIAPVILGGILGALLSGGGRGHGGGFGGGGGGGFSGGGGDFGGGGASGDW